MSELLGFMVIVEPDRQRLARLVLDTVKALGGNNFHATAMLADILSRLRGDCLKSVNPIQTHLTLAGMNLCLEWDETSESITALPDTPTEESLQVLREQLRQASESTDPELLIRRNRRISADLERAHRKAAEEMAELETVLDRKKRELQESIHIAETDSLTGLLNRGAFDTRLREIFLRRHRQGEPLCLLMLDLDNFKQVNDTRGHQEGDEHLKRVAAAMRASVREQVDFTCRIGGDEFAIIASTDLGNTQRMADNILEKLDYCASIGIAAAQEGDTIDALIGSADAALYQAKHSGRGRIVLVEDRLAMKPVTCAKAVGGA